MDRLHSSERKGEAREEFQRAGEGDWEGSFQPPSLPSFLEAATHLLPAPQPVSCHHTPRPTPSTQHSLDLGCALRGHPDERHQYPGEKWLHR